jgi:release factor glutamine methyltransferase
MNTALKYVVGKTYKPLLARYLTKTRKYSYQNINLEILPSVFHPGFFDSTLLLLKFINKGPLLDKTFLEPGAGSGLISVYAAKQGAMVTATDINPAAISCLQKNSRANHVSITIHHSDLFEDIPLKQFDIIAINPPYYKRHPQTWKDHAWYCGENGEYFEKLFGSIRAYSHRNSAIYMVLCDGCDMDMIQQQAKKNGLHLHLEHEQKTWIEKNFIYTIRFE